MSHNISSQSEFAPPGAEWCLLGYNGAGETIGFLKVRYDRDSMIGRVPTKVFSLFAKDRTPRGLVDGYFSNTELIQQSNDSIFYYVPEVRDRVFLFKESYEPEETTTTWLYNELFNVLEVNEEVIDGVVLEVAKMNLPPRLERDLPVTMYGSIGPDRGFMENWSYYLDGLGGVDLQAFRATSTPEIKIIPRTQCFALMDQEENLVTVPTPEEDCKIIAFPNPVANIDQYVRIRFNCRDYLSGDFLLRVYDAIGNEVLNPRRIGYLPTDFAVHKLPNGKYFAVVSGEGERFTFSFTKNR